MFVYFLPLLLDRFRSSGQCDIRRCAGDELYSNSEHVELYSH